jgi:EPS-associated MarR family transcriptional regulator
MSDPSTFGPEDADATPLAILRLLESDPSLTQRGLSQALGLSLGKTHYVLHALLDKGLLKIENFRRSDNKLAYGYLLTPKGLREKMAMTRAFLVRKEAEFEHLRATIAALRLEVMQQPARQTSRNDSP